MEDQSRNFTHLAEADRYIAEAEQRAAALQEQIDRMATLGMDVSSSVTLLGIVRGALITMRAHRNALRSMHGVGMDDARED